MNFLIPLDTEFLKVSVEAIKVICEETIKHEPNKIPRKFELALKACELMLQTKPVTQLQVQGMLDVVGGYYCAMELLCQNHGEDLNHLEDAVQLMKFAGFIVQIVTPFWKVDLNIHH